MRGREAAVATEFRQLALLAVVGVLTLTSCHRTEPSTANAAALVARGMARIAVSTSTLGQAAAIDHVTLTISASDFAAPIVQGLTKGTDGSQWTVFVDSIPAGPQRLFDVVAYDAAAHVIRRGSASSNIENGRTAVVTVLLQETVAPDPFGNSAPVIDSCAASAFQAAPGATVSLTVSAHDPDPSDTIAYQWEATCGGFSGPTTSSTAAWVAPGAAGSCQLSIRLTDSRGASVMAFVAVQVVDASTPNPNSWPVVTLLAQQVQITSQGVLTAVLKAVAVDPDGDPLTFNWSTTCQKGVFGHDNGTDPTQTIQVYPPPADACQVTVTVQDGRGGRTAADAVLPGTTGPSPNFVPVITRIVPPSHDVAVIAGEEVPIAVDGADPEGGLLHWSWTSLGGALSGLTALTTASPGSSHVVWTAPSSLNGPMSVTVTLTDDAGLSTQAAIRFFPAVLCTAGTIHPGPPAPIVTVASPSPLSAASRAAR